MAFILSLLCVATRFGDRAGAARPRSREYEGARDLTSGGCILGIAVAARQTPVKRDPAVSALAVARTWISRATYAPRRQQRPDAQGLRDRRGY